MPETCAAGCGRNAKKREICHKCYVVTRSQAAKAVVAVRSNLDNFLALAADEEVRELFERLKVRYGED
jgi:thermostable 8-oxoguanine DNA glycosylase